MFWKHYNVVGVNQIMNPYTTCNMDISTNDVDNDTKKFCTFAMDTNDEQKKHSTKQKIFT